jgi:hypothetical protein
MIYFREVQRLWIRVLLLAALSVPGAVAAAESPQNLGHSPPAAPLAYVALGLPALLAVWFSLGALVSVERDSQR